MSVKAILSSKGQVVIPKILRKQLGLHLGSEFIVCVKKKGIIELKPVSKTINNFFGKGKSSIIEKRSDIDDLIAKAVIENDRS